MISESLSMLLLTFYYMFDGVFLAIETQLYPFHYTYHMAGEIWRVRY